MRAYSVPVVDFAKSRKSQTVPDQSLSIQELVRRYVRGIPVDVIQRQPVYVDQSDHDLEALQRLDFGEKAAYAAELQEQAQRLQAELNELKRSASEAKAKAASAKAAAAATAPEAAAGPKTGTSA